MQQNPQDWQRLDGTQMVESGILLLAHPEWPIAGARLVHPQKTGKCGQLVPFSIAPGEYCVETLVINEHTEGDHFCVLCRWVPVEGN